MSTLPRAARDAAHEAIACRLGEPGWAEMLGKSPHELVDIALAAAEPHLVPQGEPLPPRGPDGFREITCGACGETFGTNFADDEVECPDCDARRSPCCGSWFGGDVAL